MSYLFPPKKVSLPKKRGDRYRWAEDQTFETIRGLLVCQLFWPLGGYTRSLGWGDDFWLSCWIVAGSSLIGLPILWSRRFKSRELELRLPDGTLIWQPRGAAIPCPIEAVVVRGREDVWRVEMISEIPRRRDDPEPPPTRVRWAEVPSRGEAERSARRLIAQLESIDEVTLLSDPEGQRAQEPTYPNIITAETPSRSLVQAEYHGEMQFPEVGLVHFVFLAPFGIWLLSSALIWQLRALGEEIGNRSSLDAFWVVGSLIAWIFACEWLFTGERLRLDLRKKRYYRWRGLRPLVEVRSGPTRKLGALRLVKIETIYWVILDTLDGHWFGLHKGFDQGEELEIMSYWAERFEVRSEDLTSRPGPS